MSAQPWRKNQTKLIEIFYPVLGGGASQCRPALTAALPKTLPKTSVSWITVGCEPEPGEKVVMHITRRRQQAQGRNCSLSLPLFADLLKSLPAQKSAPWIREGKKDAHKHTHFIIRNCCAARILFRLCLQRWNGGKGASHLRGKADEHEKLVIWLWCASCACQPTTPWHEILALSAPWRTDDRLPFLFAIYFITPEGQAREKVIYLARVQFRCR